MQKPYDVMARGLLEGALTGPCVVRTEESVVADARAIDTLVEPLPGRAGELASRGLLGRMALEPGSIEAFHDPPSLDEVDECLLKVIALHSRQRATWRALPLPRSASPPPRPGLWVVSAGVPDAVLEAWALAPMDGWPTGCFANASVRAPRLVVVSQLQRTRETLLLRLLGTDRVLRAAFEDLHALPEDAWEREMLAPLLALLRHDLPRMGVVSYTPEEDSMRYQEAARITEELRRKDRAEALSQGLAPLLRQFERRLGRGLTEPERAVLLARLGSLGPARLGDVVLDLDPQALAAWLTDPNAA
ncbi:MAG: hypothetical protein HY909_29370 [Deltaproteobacteria bacterium]|nr:hypothetical protein [Deltaproteobacteria bacterium]